MIRDLLTELMLVPGLAGYEERVAAAVAAHLDRLGLEHPSSLRADQDSGSVSPDGG